MDGRKNGIGQRERGRVYSLENDAYECGEVMVVYVMGVLYCGCRLAGCRGCWRRHRRRPRCDDAVHDSRLLSQVSRRLVSSLRQRTDVTARSRNCRGC